MSLTQVVDKPTRLSNILDLIFVSQPDLVQNVEIRPGISDHDSVTAEIQLKAKVSKKPRRKVFVFDKADPGKLQEEIAKLRTEFAVAERDMDADECWEFFKKGLMKTINEVVPTRILKGRHDLPWLNNPLKKKIARKNRYHRRAKKASPRHKQRRWEAYHNIQASVKADIAEAYDSYMNSLFEDDETMKPSKKFWKSLKAKKKDQVGIPPLNNKRGELQTTGKGKAEALNSQYSSVYTDEDTTSVPSTGESPFASMPCIRVTVKGVTNLLQKLNPKKAIGPDLVPTRVLKEYADEVAPILQRIFQKSLNSGKVPEDWKTANVVAIFKKGDRKIPSNYRPVSLTCVCCKTLEHIVFHSVMEHVDWYKILSVFQHGFRAKHSCETQLINTVQDLAKGLKDKEQLDLLILDFSKAFDVVPHQRLIKKLDYYGIRNSTLNWIEQWLTGRTQCVVVDGESSSKTPVKSGVPQGTVLGPLMFILYINDIAKDTTSNIRLFADDCLLYRVIRCDMNTQELQRDLTQLCHWATKWQMSFNADKCSLLRITNKKTIVSGQYTIHGKALKEVDHHPYLGLELDSKLDFNTHTKQTVSKAQRNLNLLRRNLHGCSQATKELGYKALVRPILEYTSSVWDPYTGKQMNQLGAVQAKGARFVTGQHSRRTSVTGLLQTLQWRSLQERRLVARLTMFYKAVEGKAACHIPDEFLTTTPNTRASHDRQYEFPHSRLDAYKYSFFPRTIRVWNILPHGLVHAADTDSFKAGVQEQFTSQQMYCVQPRSIFQRPRLGSTSCVSGVGPVY